MDHSKVPVSHRLLIATVLLLLLCMVATVVDCELFEQNDLRNEQPERWRMESYMSELVPIKASAGEGPSSELQQQQQSGNNNETIVHEREFTSPQAKIQIECQRDKTVIRLNFTKPFGGAIGAGNLETTKCKINGDRVSSNYRLEVLHNETLCDTQWDSSTNSIFNTLFVRFHSSLETGADLAKNIMCRLTVGDLIVGRRPAKRTHNLKQKLKSTAQKEPTP